MFTNTKRSCISLMEEKCLFLSSVALFNFPLRPISLFNLDRADRLMPGTERKQQGELIGQSAGHMARMV